MTSYTAGEFKLGLKIMYEGNPCNIIENEFVKPGKGQAFNRVKIRNLRTGRILEKTFKANESFESADVTDLDLQYLYSDGNVMNFMSPDTYEQYTFTMAQAGNLTKWLKAQDMCIGTIWDGALLNIEPPTFVVLKITETEPAVRGDTVSGAMKMATLETGANVKVPLFVNSGELIKIDTRTGDYVARIKE